MSRAVPERRSDDQYHTFQRVRVETRHPIAHESPDYQQPCGTRRDNSSHPRFNTKLDRLYGDLGRPLRVMDLGCAGGGFVKSCLDDGWIAVGIEGSDYSLRTGRAEWATLGDRFLFTADITRPFAAKVAYDDFEAPFVADVITAWEVLEHIEERDIDGVCANILEHLSPSGTVVMSISIAEQTYHGVRLHQTVKPKAWWVAKFREHGLFHQPAYERYFAGQYVRGWGPEAGASIHVTLTKGTSDDPAPPPRSSRGRLADSWFASRPYWHVRRLLGIA